MVDLAWLVHGTALVDLVVKLVLPFLRQSTTVSHSKHEALHASLYLLNQDSYHINPRKPGGWIPPPWQEILFFNMETRFKHYETPWLSQFYPTGAIGTIFCKFLGVRGVSGQISWIYKAKIEYYATKKWLESGLLYQDSIEHNIGGYMESPNWR